MFYLFFHISEYSAVGANAPTAPTAYIGVPGAPGHQVTMATPYSAYPASAYTSPAYLPSSAPTYLPGKILILFNLFFVLVCAYTLQLFALYFSLLITKWGNMHICVM